MKKAVFVLLTAGAAFAAQNAGAAGAHAVLRDSKGVEVGRAEFSEANGGVHIALHARQLSPGVHAVHIHSLGKCDGTGAFKSAGDHFNPDGKQHGKLVPGGPHAGDMDNQTADDAGKLEAGIRNPSVTLAAGPRSLFDADGSSLVIHAKPDDYKSQPAGDAGDRVACGVIERR
ncbi:MAG: superoxide dismutase family protein [Alphaproteobacteria bacterium]